MHAVNVVKRWKGFAYVRHQVRLRNPLKSEPSVSTTQGVRATRNWRYIWTTIRTKGKLNFLILQRSKFSLKS